MLFACKTMKDVLIFLSQMVCPKQISHTKMWCSVVFFVIHYNVHTIYNPCIIFASQAPPRGNVGGTFNLFFFTMFCPLAPEEAFS